MARTGPDSSGGAAAVKLILASSAPWKLEILARIGLAFKGRDHGTNEEAIPLADDPAVGVRRRAEAKATNVSATEPAALVVGLDQAMVFEGEAFGKVGTADEARAVLTRLAGARHALLVGWAVARGGEVVEAGTDTVTLVMRALSAEAIDRYVATGEWRGVAGCYRYEGVGRQLFERVDGDVDSIVGVPVGVLLPVLRRMGVAGMI
jgi:septum formation protein